MPASTERQRRLFCVALAIKKGDTPKGYSKQAAKMAETMSEQQLADYCKTQVKK